MSFHMNALMLKPTLKAKAPRKSCTSKDLLHLEGSNASTPDAKWKSICKAKKCESVIPGPLRTMPIEAVVGKSNVLSRLQAFLPALDEANRKLAEAIKEKGPDDFNIEALQSHKATLYVEMDLALGVADLYSEDAVSAAERLVDGQTVNTASLHESDSEDGKTSRQESDTENERGSPSSGSKKVAPNKRLKRDKRPKIEPLS